MVFTDPPETTAGCEQGRCPSLHTFSLPPAHLIPPSPAAVLLYPIEGAVAQQPWDMGDTDGEPLAEQAHPDAKH